MMMVINTQVPNKISNKNNTTGTIIMKTTGTIMKITGTIIMRPTGIITMTDFQQICKRYNTPNTTFMTITII